jgi:hypothetical protein
MESNLATAADLERHHRAKEGIVAAPADRASHPAASSVSLGKIVLGVFLGNVVFAVVAVLFYGLATGSASRW